MKDAESIHPGDQGLSDVAAGRQTLARLDALVAARRDIAFETTLASRMLLARIRAMQVTGYSFHLTFFWLPSADMAVERVAKRVASGGHSSWVLINNNNTSRPGRPLAWRKIGAGLEVLDNALWSELLRRYMKPPRVEQPRVAVKDADEIARLRKVFDPEEIFECVNRAVTAAYKRHKERGESIVIWRDGKIVTLKPEEIDV